MRQVSDWAKGLADGFADAPQNILKGTVDLIRNPGGALAESQQAMQYVFQQGQNGNFGPAGQVEGTQLGGVVLGVVGNELAGGLLGRGTPATSWPQSEAAFWQGVDLSGYGASGSSGGLIGQGQVPVYANPLAVSGNGSPVFSLGWAGASAPRATAAGVLLDPRLPDPVAGTNYMPATLDSSNPNIANSHANGYVSELQLANQVVALPNQQVIKFGDVIGAHGSDVISVDASTGEVFLWDSKFRSGSTSISQSPTFADPKTQASAIKEAMASIANASLPAAVKQKALDNLQSGNFVTNTVGSGNAKNSYQVRYCGGEVCK